VHPILGAIAVAAAYLGLGGVSAWLAFAPSDAWTVWLASGLTVGLVAARPRASWPAILTGAAVGAAVFAMFLGSGLVDAAGYALIEVVIAAAGASAASMLAPLPLGLARPREVLALLTGVSVMSIVGAILAAGWTAITGGAAVSDTFRLWFLSNAVGTMLVAPAIIAWMQFRPKRSGGLAMSGFVAGGIASLMFLAGLWLIFNQPPGSREDDVTYLPVLLMALVALLWGARGATLLAFLGAVIALACTVNERGPFADTEGFLGEAAIAVQVYAVVIALTGLLIATLAAAQRSALLDARDWRTRFEAAIGAHRLLAYEWDPASGRFALTGDSRALLGVAPESVTTLADWLGLVDADARERVQARFGERTALGDAPDTMGYAMRAGGSVGRTVTDEANAIRDHDGTLHRIVGIVRVQGPVQA
jgi:integral membrane sensor domain MASE1